MVVPLVPGDQVVAGDRVDRRVLDHARQRRVVAVDQPPEFAAGDLRDVVVAAGDRRLGLSLGQVDLFLVEDRITQHVHEDAQHVVEVFLEAVHRRRAVLAAHAGLDEGGPRGEEVVDLVAGHRLRAALAHGLAEDAAESGLVRRLVVRSGADARRHADQRQLVILHEEQLDAVVQRVDLGPGDFEFGQLGELDLAVILDLGRRGEREQGQDGQGRRNESNFAVSHLSASLLSSKRLSR